MLFRSKSRTERNDDTGPMDGWFEKAQLPLPRTLPRLDSSYKSSKSLLEDQNTVTVKGELLGLNIRLQIPFTQVGASKNGKIFIQYVIRLSLPPPPTSTINTPAKEWDSKKRYSQFVDLDKQLKQILGKKEVSKLIALPPKRYLNSFEDSVILERKRGLAEYLQSSLNAVMNSNEAANFLAVFLEMPGSKVSPSFNLTRREGTTSESATVKTGESTAVTTTTIEGEAHHGFLFKRGGLYQNKPFKISFCVLNFEEGIFRFYRTSRPQLLGAIKLKDQVDAFVEILQPGELGVPEDGFGFKLFTPERELIMYSETLEDRSSWILAINKVLQSSVSNNLTQNHKKIDESEFSSYTRKDTAMSYEEEVIPVDIVTNTPITVEVEEEEIPEEHLSPLTKPATKPTKSKLIAGTPVQLAARELEIISKIQEDWAIDWNDLEILEKVGGGAFGTVYKGKCWGSVVAVKQLNTSGAITPELKLALEKEVGVLSKLRHPNILLYIGAASTDTNAAMVTEWCEKKSLYDILKSPHDEVAFDAKLFLKFALEVARGMCYLHSRKERIIHRDLKSLNVLITQGYNAKVADFGLTVMREAAARQTVRLDSGPKHHRDTTGSLFSNSGADFFGTEGTAQWMAPEVMEGARYNHKVDVYSYGILITELLTRKMPFKDLYGGFDFVDAVLDRAERPTIPYWTKQNNQNIALPSNLLVEEELDDHTSEHSEINPTELGNLMIKCTNRDPQLRPDFSQIIGVLERLIERNSDFDLFQKFDLPRIRESLELGDYDDVCHTSKELYDITRELLSGGRSEEEKLIVRKFIAQTNVIPSCCIRIGYGKASKVVERGGEYEQEELPKDTLVDLVCCIRQLIQLSYDPPKLLQTLYTPKKDPLLSIIELFLRPDLDQRGIDAAGTLLNDFRTSSTKLKGVFDELVEQKLEEIFDEKKNPLFQNGGRRRTLVVSDREVLLWRCRAFDILPNKFSKKIALGAAKDEIKALELEIRSIELSLIAKRRQFLEAVKKDINKDVERV